MPGTAAQQRSSCFLGEFVSLLLICGHIQKSGNLTVPKHPIPATASQFGHNVVEKVVVIIWRNGAGDAAVCSIGRVFA